MRMTNLIWLQDQIFEMLHEIHITIFLDTYNLDKFYIHIQEFHVSKCLLESFRIVYASSKNLGHKFLYTSINKLSLISHFFILVPHFTD